MRFESLPREQWIALVPAAHDGYITWDEYEDHQRRLRENSQAQGAERRKSPPREGPALLQGLVLCGRCAERMTVRYHRSHGRLQEAKLKLPHASVEAIDYPARRELDKAVICQLATCRWVDEHQQVLITGATGTGKSFVACALAQHACRRGYRAYYRRTSRLLHNAHRIVLKGPSRRKEGIGPPRP